MINTSRGGASSAHTDPVAIGGNPGLAVTDRQYGNCTSLDLGFFFSLYESYPITHVKFLNNIKRATRTASISSSEEVISYI